jgi:hypothetical protein
MARFVILTHDWPVPHWDFLAERNGVLRAWRILAEPRAGVDLVAEPNADHRLYYLDYEGPVSGGRGTVARFESGTCEWIADTATGAELAVRGSRFVGRVTITLRGEGWVFRFAAEAESHELGET